MSFFENVVLLWEKLKLLGTGLDIKMNKIIGLMNQIVFIGGIVCWVMAVTGLVLDLGVIYIFSALSLGTCLFSVLVFNAYNKIHTARFILAGFLPFVIAVFIVLLGGSFGEESILTIILFFIYILYNEKPKERIWYYIALATSYLTASTYLFFYPPILTSLRIDNPYDNIFAFLVCVLWVIKSIWLYQKEVSIHQEKQNALIEALKQKNAHLEKTTEELEQFTYIASHDLKSPLRTIISFLDLIKRDIRRQKYDELLSKLDFAKSGAEQMNFLVTDILEYSKITTGKKRSQKSVCLQAVVDKVRFNLMDIIEKKGVELYTFPMPEFYCNETEMTVLFQNFIENGIKYNEESTPTIFVKATIEDKWLTLQFIDNGIGMEEQYFEKIFLLFKRLHTSNIYPGTGLGLGLCKKIIDDMNGKVSVESTLNVGSTFTIRLPIIDSLSTEKVKPPIAQSVYS